MKIFFAGDHAGFELKQKLIEFVKTLGHDVEDLGPLAYDEGDDYTDYVIPLARKVAGQGSTLKSGERSNLNADVRGIVVAGSGQGEIIALNRVSGVRAALFCSCKMDLITASRDHNDSNIFCIGARFCTEEEAKAGTKLWLDTPFSNAERHIRRLEKIDRMH